MGSVFFFFKLYESRRGFIGADPDIHLPHPAQLGKHLSTWNNDFSQFQPLKLSCLASLGIYFYLHTLNMKSWIRYWLQCVESLLFFNSGNKHLLIEEYLLKTCLWIKDACMYYHLMLLLIMRTVSQTVIIPQMLNFTKQ